MGTPQAAYLEMNAAYPEFEDGPLRLASIINGGMKNAPDLNPTQFTSMMRLDHNRALTQIAEKTGKSVAEVKGVSVWGNHSGTQYPDIFNVKIDGKNATTLTGDFAWIEQAFIPAVKKRGDEIIKARNLSSAASAANAAINHMSDWLLGTPKGDWVSMGIPSDGTYGIPEGVTFGYPVSCSDGHYKIVTGLDLPDFSTSKIKVTHNELLEERAAIEALIK